MWIPQLKPPKIEFEHFSVMKILKMSPFFAANEDTPQVYAACGFGPRSSLRVLRHGLEVTEMAVSELPGNPNAVWTVKKRADGNTYFLLLGKSDQRLDCFFAFQHQSFSLQILMLLEEYLNHS